MAVLGRQAALLTLFGKLLNHAVQVRVAGAKPARQPIPAAFGNPLAVRDHFKLTGLPRRSGGFNAKALLDEGHETRGLGLVVLSGRAVDDFDLHGTEMYHKNNNEASSLGEPETIFENPRVPRYPLWSRSLEVSGFWRMAASQNADVRTD